MYRTLLFLISFFLVSYSHAALENRFSEKEILNQIQEDIKNIPMFSSFSSIIDRWSHQYGTQAVQPLYKLTADASLDENTRYITLMAMVKSGGLSTLPWIHSLLKDPSWNIKVGSLKAMRMLAATHPQEKLNWGQEQLETFRNLLQDKALVVRNETVLTIESLKIKELTTDLLQALHSHSNYLRGKPLWVPQKILRALPQMEKNEKNVLELLPLLENMHDPEFLSLTVQTLEKISSHHPEVKKNASIQQKVAAWKNHLRKL